MPLDRVPSKFIVGELIRVLGEASALDLLAVTPARLKALEAGRGCLKDEQLLRITAKTGRSWMRWGVDPIARGPRTVAQKKLDAATYQMLDRIDPPPNGARKPTGSPKPNHIRSNPLRQRQAV